MPTNAIRASALFQSSQVDRCPGQYGLLLPLAVAKLSPATSIGTPAKRKRGDIARTTRSCVAMTAWSDVGPVINRLHGSSPRPSVVFTVVMVVLFGVAHHVSDGENRRTAM